MVNRICRFSYELAIILCLLILVFLPFHTKATRHYNISQAYSYASLVSFRVDTDTNLRNGDVVPIYRFWEGYQQEIGRAMVYKIKGKEILCSYEPDKFRWPMGRHGQIIKVYPPYLKISLGSQLGLKNGDKLYLFDKTKLIGTTEIIKVFDDYSLASLPHGKYLNLTGLFVSEYTVATQAAFFKNKLLSLFEIIFIL
ncbi:MAG: hypothetical protein NTZ48_03700, partial [Candidatus Omnitrophica bacterium]|nr:hypothetical protein [Candidatus Omnitrophota bacterium]